MALGPGGRTGKALARELPATLQGRKGHEKSSSFLLGPKETKHPFLYGLSLTSSGEGLSWEVRGEAVAVPGGHRQIWCMALSPGQKDLAESRQAREATGYTPSHCLPLLRARGGGPTLFLPSLVRSKWWFLEESIP